MLIEEIHEVNSVEIGICYIEIMALVVIPHATVIIGIIHEKDILGTEIVLVRDTIEMLQVKDTTQILQVHDKTEIL